MTLHSQYDIKDIKDFMNTVSYTDFKDLIDSYAHKNNKNPKRELRQASIRNLQEKLIQLNINTSCPHCNSDIIVKNGTRNDIQRFKCGDCNRQFILFTNTILEKTKYHWNIWVKMLEMTINKLSIEHMANVLKKDFACDDIDNKTVWHWRLKLLYALSLMPTPTLTGVIQIDETFVYESQKGERELINFLKKDEPRLPRKGRRASEAGVLSPEFVTIVVAVDNSKHSVMKAISQGKFDASLFKNEFSKHFNNPSFICTDSHLTYKKIL